LSLENLTESKKRILELLAEKKEADVQTIATTVGLRSSTVRKYLAELERSGLVERVGSVAKITEKALQLLRAKTERPSEEQPVEEVVTPKPSEQLIEPFYFLVKGSLVPLRIKNKRQLAATIVYGLIEPEELSYVLRTGYLITWLRTALREEELAKKLEELKGLEPPQLYDEATKILREHLD